MRQQALHPRTAMINKQQKNDAKKSRNEALIWLATTFPHAFDTSVSIHPLKLGIMLDILAHEETAALAGISKSKLREAVVIFTRRIDYLTCLKAREMRVDLEGNPVVPVTEEEASHAALKIKKRVEKSAKNARKTLVSKVKINNNSEIVYPKHAPLEEARVPYYPERPPAFSAQNNGVSIPRAAAVMVKHKSTRAYDPDAVARLKAKLGLSRSNSEVSQETTEPLA